MIEESDFSVNMTAHGFPPPTKYSWLKNGAPLQETHERSRAEVLVDNSISAASLAGAKTHALRHRDGHHNRPAQQKARKMFPDGPLLKIYRVNRYDGGEYECEVFNSEGTSKATIVINVLCEYNFVPFVNYVC